MIYSSDTRTEFYRDTGIQVVSPEMQIRPLARVPGENFSGYRALLMAAGNLLISAGVKLKILALPAAHFSREAS